MSNLLRKKHLSLVARSSPLTIESESSTWPVESVDVQGSKAITLYLFRESDVFRNSDFPGFLKAHNVRILFDARVAPRLDFVATTRVLAFKKFEELDVNYIDIQGWIAEEDGKASNGLFDELALIVSERVRALEISSASIFFIFDSHDFHHRANRSLLPTMNFLFKDSDIHFNAYTGDVSEAIAM